MLLVCLLLLALVCPPCAGTTEVSPPDRERDEEDTSRTLKQEAQQIRGARSQSTVNNQYIQEFRSIFTGMKEKMEKMEEKRDEILTTNQTLKERQAQMLEI